MQVNGFVASGITNGYDRARGQIQSSPIPFQVKMLDVNHPCI